MMFSTFNTTVSMSKKEKDEQLIKDDDDDEVDEDRYSVAINNPIYDVDPDEKPGVDAYYKPGLDDDDEEVKVNHYKV